MSVLTLTGPFVSQVVGQSLSKVQQESKENNGSVNAVHSYYFLHFQTLFRILTFYRHVLKFILFK